VNYLQARALARTNRKNPTPSENRLWQSIRARKLNGLKFSRQHLIKYKLLDSTDSYFIADFFCHSLSLIIEVDGHIHKNQKAYDDEREECLRSMGFRIIRLSNEEVFSDLENVHVSFQILYSLPDQSSTHPLIPLLKERDDQFCLLIPIDIGRSG